MRSTALGTLSIVFLALLPFITSNSLFYGAIGAKFFAVVVFVDSALLFGAYYFFNGRQGFSLRGRWYLGALVLALLMQVASAVLGLFPDRSLWSDIFWSSGLFFLTHLALLSFVLAEFLTERDWTGIRRAIAVSSGVFGFLLIIGVDGLGYTGHFLWLNLGEGSLSMGNQTYAGAYLLLALIIGLIEFFRTRRATKWRRALGISLLFIVLSPILINTKLLIGMVPFTSVLTSPTALLGATRASSATMFVLLGFIMGYVILRRFLPSPWGLRAALVWSAGLCAGIVTLVTLLFVPGSAVQNAYIQESTAARVYVWEASIEALKDRPFFGWGPENFNYAIERHFDNRLFEDKNYGEIWFERAHNVFLDTLVSVGIIGALAVLLLLGFYFWIVYRARREGHIAELEAVLLSALPLLHILQMQTSFDTIGSYTLLATMGGYALWLERRLLPGREKQSGKPHVWEKAIAILLLATALASILLALGEYRRQVALPLTFKGKSAAEQQEYMEKSLSRVSSFESLRLSSSSFIKGSLSLIAENPTEERTERILEFTHRYETHYQKYLAEQPQHYRARMNYAYLLLIMTTLGENRVEDAKQIIQESYVLSPGNPLTYVLDALAELYRGNLVESDRLMKEALAINPDIEFTKEAAAYFKEQQELFPNLIVLKLTNL